MARWVAAGVILVLAVLAVATARFATRHGSGMSPDSRGYLMSAQFLGEGRGLSMWSGADESGRDTVTPMVHAPPLYPSLLTAAGRVLGGDVQAAARTIGTGMYALNVALVALLAWRASSRSPVAAILAAAAAVAAVDLLFVHSMVWTEPLFVFFGFLGLYFIGVFLDTERTAALIAGAIAVAIAFEARYAGASLVFAVGLVLALRRASPLRWVRDLFLFGVITCTPMLLWMLRNRRASGDADAHTAAWHPPTLGDVKSTLLTFASWAWPDAVIVRTPRWMYFGLFVAAAAGVLVLWVIVRDRARWRRRGRRDADGHAGSDARGEAESSAPAGAGAGGGLRRTLAWFVPVYFVFIVVTISFFDAHVPLDERILLPIHVALIPLAAATIVAARPAWLRYVGVAGVVVLVASQAVRAVQWAAAAPDQHLHYGMRQWINSPTLAEVRKLPPQSRIYTNGTDVVYLRAGRFAYPIPRTSDPTKVAAEPRLISRMRQMRDGLRRHDGRVVYFTNIPRTYLAPVEKLDEFMRLEVVKELPDGIIYRLQSAPATTATAPVGQ